MTDSSTAAARTVTPGAFRFFRDSGAGLRMRTTLKARATAPRIPVSEDDRAASCECLCSAGVYSVAPSYALLG